MFKLKKSYRKWTRDSQKKNNAILEIVLEINQE